MNFNEYQMKTEETAIYPPETALEYLTLGLCSEAGEVAGKIKKLIRDGGSLNEVSLAVASELGDVLWYVARLADFTGYSLESIAEMNIDKLFNRKERGVLGGDGDRR